MENVMAYLNDALKHNRMSSDKINYSKVANSSLNIGYLDGEKIDRVIIYLGGKGCEWNCKKNGGCLMCGHYYGTARGEEIPNNSFFEQFLDEFNKYNFTDIPVLCIYNAGSILNPNEVPTEELLRILKIVSKNSNIKRIILESRPEFVNEKLLSSISKICDGKIIEIGMGLETTDDYIRKTCINKGFSFIEYLKAVCMIKCYHNLKVLTYITVKPLFLTIQESIDDVCKSINDIAMYTDIISLEPISLQKNTVVEYLYKLGLYEPPKGWIIKDIIEKLNEYSISNHCDIRIGGFEYYPIPDSVIENCEKCNKQLYEAIDMYNSSKQIDLLMNLNCDCYIDYINDKRKEETCLSIEERAKEIIRKVLQKIVA